MGDIVPFFFLPLTVIMTKLSNSARKRAVEEIYLSLQTLSWECCGGGEITCPLYAVNAEGETVLLGELSGDNGQNTLYNPEGKPWVERIEDKSDEWLLRAISLLH